MSDAQLLLLIGAGVMAEGYLDAAEQKGLQVALVESESRLKSLRTRYGCIVDSEVVTGPIGLDEAWYEPALALAQRRHPDAVLGFSEPHVMAASLIQSVYQLPGPGVVATAISRNKALQRAVFANAGLSQPAVLLVAEIRDATNWAEDRFPIVVKPLSGMGSTGVELVADSDAWAELVERRTDSGPTLVEEYIDGPEFSIEALVKNGKLVFSNLTHKETTGPPHFVEISHTIRTQSEIKLEDSRDFIESVIDAMQVKTGIVHAELKLDNKNGKLLSIMEVAVRSPGDHLMELICLAYDCNIYDECISLALNETPRFPATVRMKRAAGIAFSVANFAGLVESTDASIWEKENDIVRYYMMTEPGDKVKLPESSSDRLGYAILDCPDENTLNDTLSRVQREAVVTINPRPSHPR